MPPKHKSQAGGCPKHKTQKAPVKVKAVSRATRVQNQGDQVATPPRPQGRSRSHQLTRAQVAHALDGLDLCIQPTSLPRVDAASTRDALRALDIDMDIMDPPMNSGAPAPRMGNQEEVMRLQAQLQRLGTELSNLHMCQSSTASNPSSGTGNGASRGQGSGLDQGYQPPVVGASYPMSDTMSEWAMPMTRTPSEVPRVALMLQDQTPRGADAIPAFNNRSEDFETWILQLEAVASHYKWTAKQKRGLILSNLQEEAVTFIFKTLTDQERQDYNLLVKALTGQFTEIESRKVYRLRYRNLQQPGESEQQLAARAKVIYDQACPGRDEKVRQEDLVNAFLEVLQDDDQHRALEYPRVPDTIKEAALQAAHYW